MPQHHGKALTRLLRRCTPRSKASADLRLTLPALKAARASSTLSGGSRKPSTGLSNDPGHLSIAVASASSWAARPGDVMDALVPCAVVSRKNERPARRTLLVPRGQLIPLVAAPLSIRGMPPIPPAPCRSEDHHGHHHDGRPDHPLVSPSPSPCDSRSWCPCLDAAQWLSGLHAIQTIVGVAGQLHPAVGCGRLWHVAAHVVMPAA